MSEPTSRTVSWSWFLPRAAVVALVEGGLLGATLFGWEGGEFRPAMWLLIAAMIAVGAIGAGALANRIGGGFQPRSANAPVALVVGSVVGFVVGYLVQPRSGPV
jgi:hypothetical protein